MNDTNSPLVSILVRSMDRPTLDRALRSAASQTWPNLEIIVVAACGSSHRNLGDSFAQRPVRMVYPEPDRNLPRPDAANVALDSAQGEWINFLDDDDELLEHHLDTLLSASRKPDEQIIYSRSLVRDANEADVGTCGIDGRKIHFFYENLMTPNAALIHRDVLASGARFDPAFAIYEDHDFFINCAARTNLRFVDTVSCVWNAYVGESGCGHGDNNGVMRRGELSERLRKKWAEHFNRWAREPGALLTTGQHFLIKHDFEAAHHCLEWALSMQPEDINALNLCGMANYHLGKLERAKALLERALRKLPQHRGLAENLAMIRRKLG